MLTTNQILKLKPTFILSVNYDAGSLADMLGEYDRDDNSENEYLAEMIIQYHSLTNDACLSFTTECLISLNDNKVAIEQMNTCPDMLSVYSNNIIDLPNDTIQVWGYDTDESLHNKLLDLIESQPIDDIPEHFIIESY